MAVASKKRKIFDGRYEVLSIVGRGACSVVYHARHASNPASEVALKVLINKKGGSSSTDRLRKEALAMVSSRHKYVIRLDDFHSVQDLCYLSMEYAKEGDLRKYSAKLGGKLPAEQAVTFFKQVAEALNFVHRVGITHRDIKPDNILVLNDHETRLTDFGVAVLPGEIASLDDLQQGVGTMNYMAPEVLQGIACDKLSDIYALGVSFYEILSGKHPFDDIPLVKQLDVRKNENLVHICKVAPDTPAFFGDIIMRCMDYTPDRRFSSMNELVKELSQAADKSVTQKRRTPRIATKVGGRVRKNSGIKASHKTPKQSQTKQPAPTPPPPPAQEAIDDEFDKEIEDILSELENEDEFSAPDEAVQAKEQSIPQEEEPLQEDEIEDAAASSYLKDPRKNKLHQRDKPSYIEEAYEREPRESEAPKQSYFTLIIIALLIVYAGNYLLSKLFGVRIFGSDKEVSYYDPTYSTSAIIPAFKGTLTSFPDLPGGIYGGYIHDVIPGISAPLTVISLPDQRALVFIVGIDGWTPTLSTIPEVRDGTPPARVRVASNGIVLDMEANVADGAIYGEYINAIDGSTGRWRVTPIRD